MSYQENLPRQDDWVVRSYNWFHQFGFLVWPEQKVIYEQLAKRLSGKTILEAGCGIGYGTALFSLRNRVIGTDVLPKHVAFAKQAYSWCDFELWDILVPTPKKADILVAVEVIEHISNYRTALKNMLAVAPEGYISTPNRNNQSLGQDRPINKLHVREFTVQEMLKLLPKKTELLHWQTFEKLAPETKITPLVYHYENPSFSL